MREETARRIFREKMGGEPLGIALLAGGQVGRVFRVDTREKAYLVKLVEAGESPSAPDDVRDNRVYGAKWSNLIPAYELLVKNGIAVARLHASGTLASERLHYAILDYLEGEPADHSPEWFSCLGESLGALHGVTRPHPGWIGMGATAESWVDAFSGSLRSRLATAQTHLDAELYQSVRAYASRVAPHLGEPKHFVLSHTDGFEGVFRKRNGGWELLGVVDIEDHQFTDQRFVLSGLELWHDIWGRRLPREFWESYRTDIEPGYAELKPLFQIYYLLVWVWVLKAQRELFGQCLAKLRELMA